MKELTAGILGFISVVLALTLFGSMSFSFGIILFAVTLYLFFYAPFSLALAYLIGITAGYELLGGQRFGEATMLAFVTLLVYHFFGERLRFTSQYARYIVGLLLVAIVYSLLLFSWHTFFIRVIPLLIAYLASILITYPLASRNHPRSHELFRPFR